MKSRSCRLPFLFLLPALAGSAATQAAVMLVGRDSALNGGYLIGAGPVVLTGGGSDAETSLAQRAALEITGGDEAAGTLLGQPWTAAAAFTAGHDFLVEASPAGRTRFASTGSTTASTTTTGGGVGGTGVRNPGNRLELQFTLDSPTEYALQVTASDSNADNTVGGVQLGVFTGSIWAPLVNFADTTDFQEDVLPAGLYRLVATASAQADANETVFSGWSYDVTFTPVPEPVTAGLMAAALGLAAAARRARPGRRGLLP